MIFLFSFQGCALFWDDEQTVTDGDQDTPSETEQDQDGDTTLSDGDETESDGDETENPEKAWAGTWGLLLEMTYTACGYPLVTCQDSARAHYLLVNLREENDRMVLQGKVCQIVANNLLRNGDFERDALAYTVYPDAYTKNLLPMTWTFSSVLPIPIAEKAVSSVLWDIRGAQLTHPATDPLPTRDNLDDPAIWDQDKDGQPGMTTIMDGVVTGSIYLAERFSMALLATESPKNHLSGYVNFTYEQSELGASNPSYLVDVTITSYEKKEFSYFRMLRLSADADCETVTKLAEIEGGFLHLTPTLNDSSITVP